MVSEYRLGKLNLAESRYSNFYKAAGEHACLLSATSGSWWKDASPMFLFATNLWCLVYTASQTRNQQARGPRGKTLRTTRGQYHSGCGPSRPAAAVASPLLPSTPLSNSSASLSSGIKKSLDIMFMDLIE